ncbi:MAG: agmatinase [Elusimicrobiota bacterium]|jgi:agmatinase|nr:agmatinase [Elusimicrobiota bacterium]
MYPETVKHFLAVEDGQPSLKQSDFAVIPVPYERTVSYGGGTERGPQAILNASPQVELWDEETKTETYKHGIHTLPPINCKGSEQAVFARIEKYVENYLTKNNPFPFFLGGEHSISQALINPYINKYGKKLSVLHFDAHADLRREYFGDTRSHACAVYPASRKVRLVQVGIRSVGLEEKQNINSGNVKTFLMHKNLDIKKLIPQVLTNLTDTVYMTIDVDGFDPSVIPGTGTPQPGGFMWYEALALFKAIIAKKNIAAVDIVETAPIKGSHITEFNVAKLIYRLMGYLSLKKENIT